MTSAFAKRFWGDAEAIGHRMTYFDERNSYYNIVGVADDIRALGLQEAANSRSVFPDRRPARTRRSGSHSATCTSSFALRR